MTADALWREPASRALDGFSIDLGETALPIEARSEPLLLGLPFLVEFEETAPLDPVRASDAEDDGPTVLPDPPGPSVRPLGPFGSLAIHLVVAATLLLWDAAPLDVPRPIPVQLVLEEPAPPPERPAEKPPPPGRLASEDFGEVKPPQQGAGAPAAADPAPKPQAAPPAAQTPPPDKPEAREQVAARPVPKPAPPAPAPPKPATSTAAPQQPKAAAHEAPRAARFAGPSATRDEYLAYLLALTRQHMDLLPLSLIGERAGETILSIRILDDGTIARIAVAQSSGYPDIDQRVERMVQAVRRFPPLPQWTQAPSMEVQLQLRFPEALRR